jgi:hypothetical protein
MERCAGNNRYMVNKGAQEFDFAVSFAGEDRDFVK